MGDTATQEKCMALAQAQGFKYFAVQWYDQCWGGNSIADYVTPGICDTPCKGNTTQNCGGGCANTIFKITAGVFKCLWAHKHPGGLNCNGVKVPDDEWHSIVGHIASFQELLYPIHILKV